MSDASIDSRTGASQAVVESAVKTVPVVPEIPPETAAESSDSALEGNVVKTVPEATAVTDEAPVSAAAVVAPAAVAGDAASTVTGSVTETTVENMPAPVADKTVPVPAVEETSTPEGAAASGDGLDGLSGEGELDKAIPAATGVVDESTTEPAVGETEPAALETAAVSAVNLLKASKLELFAGATFMNFGYTEFDADGAWLDEENGRLPGLLLGGALYWPNWYASLELNYYFGKTEYQGQTQSADPSLSGLPITSHTVADIFDTIAIAGYPFSAATVYGGLGYYFWQRNIYPTATSRGLRVAGVLESYSWIYALLGLKVPLFVKEDARISLDIRATRMLQALMKVDFLGYGGYDNARLNLGEDWGFRFALPWTFRSFNQDSTITVEPYYTIWDLKRSNTTELTVNGVGTGSGVVEPRSETRNFGVSIYFRYSM